MKNEQILEAALAAKQFENGIFIGKIIELPNRIKLVCVDRSHLRFKETTILSRYDLKIEKRDDITPTPPLVSIVDNEIIFTKWVDMVDNDGDIHHCKVESRIETTGDMYQPIEEDTYWAVYIQL